MRSYSGDIPTFKGSIPDSPIPSSVSRVLVVSHSSLASSIPATPAEARGARTRDMQVWKRFARVRRRAALFLMCKRRDVGRYASRIWPRREGLQRMSLGRLPIVVYTGYAVLFPNNVSCVLSEEIITGTTVAPGFSRSSSFFTMQYNQHQMHAQHIKIDY